MNACLPLICNKTMRLKGNVQLSGKSALKTLKFVNFGIID